MKKIGLAITSFNEHRRPGMLLRAARIATACNRIEELVVVDDSGDGTEGAKYFANLAPQIRAVVPTSVNVRCIENPINLGVFGNKLAAIRASSSEYVQSLDSDNAIDQRFLDRLFDLEWLPHLAICPSFAKPQFDYREQAGRFITLSNIAEFTGWNRFFCLMNTGNSFFHRQTMLELFRDFPVEHFQLAQPDYFAAQGKRIDRHWRAVFDAGDSFFFNKRWLMAGNEMLVAPGLEYLHEVHPSSSWQAAPAEKDILPVIYSLELLDKSRGEDAAYLYEGMGMAKVVHPPLPAPQNSSVVVMRRRCGNSLTRIWVSMGEAKILRSNPM